MADLLVPSVTPQFSEAPMRAPEIVAPHIYAPNIQSMNQSNAFANNPILDAAFEYVVKAKKAEDNARASHAVTSYMQKVQGDIDKLDSLSGQEQVDFANQLQKENPFVQYGNDVLKDIDDKDVQNLAAAKMQEVYDKGTAIVARTGLMAKVKWNQAESQATANQLAQDAGRAIGTPEFDAKMNTMVEEGVNRYAKSLGITIGSASYNDLLLKFNDGVYDSAVTQMIGQRQWGQAQAMLNAYKERMTFDTWGKLNLRLRKEKEHYEMVQANRLAAEARRKQIDEERARANLADKFKPMSVPEQLDRIAQHIDNKVKAAQAMGATVTPEMMAQFRREATTEIYRQNKDLENINDNSFLIRNQSVSLALEAIQTSTTPSQFVGNILDALDKDANLKDAFLQSFDYKIEDAKEYLARRCFNDGSSNDTRLADYKAIGTEDLANDSLYQFVKDNNYNYDLGLSLLMSGSVVEKIDGTWQAKQGAVQRMSYDQAKETMNLFRQARTAQNKARSKDSALKNELSYQAFGTTYSEFSENSAKGKDVYFATLAREFIDQLIRTNPDNPREALQNNMIKVEQLKQKAEAHEEQLGLTVNTYATAHGVSKENVLDAYRRLGLDKKDYLSTTDVQVLQSELELIHRQQVSEAKAKDEQFKQDSSIAIDRGIQYITQGSYE